MERETSTVELIELGAASVETQGIVGVITDQQLGQPLGGLSDE